MNKAQTQNCINKTFYFLNGLDLQFEKCSPFGVKLKGRNLNKTGNTELYRSGFQGQEEVDELKGDGNSVNYTFGMHDPRLGRLLKMDPLVRNYPWNSTYSFSCKNVIIYVELEGKEIASPEVFEEAEQALLCWFEGELLCNNEEKSDQIQIFGVHFIVISSIEVRSNVVNYTFMTEGKTGESSCSIEQFLKVMRGLFILENTKKSTTKNTEQ